MEAQTLDFSVNALAAGMPDFFWGGGMWMFPLVMIIVMLVMAYLMCGRGARPFCGHLAQGVWGGVAREDPLDILKRRYAKGEITKEEFERIRKDLRGEPAA